MMLCNHHILPSIEHNHRCQYVFARRLRPPNHAPQLEVLASAVGIPELPRSYHSELIAPSVLDDEDVPRIRTIR